MFSSAYFNPEYFNEYFKVSGDVVELPGSGGGKAVKVNQKHLKALGLTRDDEDVMEFIVAFVLSR